MFNNIRFKTLYSIAIIALSFTACKKSKNISDLSEVESNLLQTPTINRAYLTRDSIYLYTKQTYLWNVGMPNYDTFNPRRYSNNDQVIAAIRALGSNGGKDKYSFIDDGDVAAQLGGTGGDYGFSVFFDENSILRVKYVYENSPSYNKGLKRGYKIIKINGSSNINTTDDRVAFVVDAVFGANPSISLTLKRPDDTTFDIVIDRGKYTINPILYTNTYTVGTKKIGYIVFNSFTTNATSLLDDAFANFSANGITELVVDLRYNGGGSVATAEALTNLIAPKSQNGKIMYTTYWTQTMQDKKAVILENQKFFQTGSDGIRRMFSMLDYDYAPTKAAGNQELFAKRGHLGSLSRVYFVVTNSTASASELLINNLKPVMDVKLIGRKTYGKPVGFFAIRIDKYDLYVPQFQTKNQKNEGDYFAGMNVDKDLADDVTKDFGDPTERLLAQALYYSANGNFTYFVKDNAISSINAMPKTKSDDLTAKMDLEFKGMIEMKKLKFK
jgi:carboxyl-terminal processing protease